MAAREKKSKLLSIFAKHGYKSQTDLARAIQKKGLYENSESFRSYLNQVINSKRPASPKLLNALSSVCNNDSSISTIMVSPSSPEERDASFKYGLECKFDDAYNLLKDKFLKEDSNGRMAFILDFEKYVKGKTKKDIH